MTGKNHVLFAGALAFTLGYSPPEAVCIASLATIPDRIERIGTLRILRHRGVSHDLALWIFLYLLLVLFERRGFIPAPLFSVDAREMPVLGNFLISYGFYTLSFSVHVLLLGPIFHLFADALTPMGIRFAGEKVRFPLCRTDHPSEFMLVSFLFIWWAVVGWYAPRLDPAVIVAAGKTFVLYPSSFAIRLAAVILPLLPLFLFRILMSRRARTSSTEAPESAEEIVEKKSVILKTRGICGREVEIRLEPDGKENVLVADLQELRNLWIPASLVPSSETTPKTETKPDVERTEPREEPQKTTEPEATGNESPPSEDRKETVNSSPEGRLKKLLEEYRKDFDRCGLSEAVDRVADLLLSEGALPFGCRKRSHRCRASKEPFRCSGEGFSSRTLPEYR